MLGYGVKMMELLFALLGKKSHKSNIIKRRMASKQTAVDYIIRELSAILGPVQTEPLQDLLMVDAVSKAKAMHKEQVMDAYMDAYGNSKEPEDYYNETYGK